MTTTAFDDQFTPSTQTIEIVHAPYAPIAILKRNVAELELALKRQTERAEKTEAELAKLREQKPVAWCDPVEFNDDPWSFQGFRRRTSNYPTMAIYAAPIPAVHAEWREVMSKLVGIVESSTKFHGCDDVTKQARALLQSAEVQAGDKWNLTPAPTHPVDRNAGEVRHD